MTWQYISGFFDADGSITYTKASSIGKTIQLCFHNNRINILLEIQSFIFKELGFKGSIHTKKKMKENHHTAYDLTFKYHQAYVLCSHIRSIHPKKLHRINTCLKYYKQVTPRNGKYYGNRTSQKLAFNRLFFWDV